MTNKIFMRVFCVLLFSAFLFPLSAQGSDGSNTGDEDINSETPIQSNWLGEKYSLYTRGDKILSINLGALFPLLFTDKDYKKIVGNVNIGGAASFAFSYFFTPSFFIGGALKGSFSPTLAKNNLFLVPMVARAGYQFIWSRFEFPISLGIGGAAHSYLLKTLYGMFMDVEAGAYFRFNPDWSFGLSTSFWWAPEWTVDPARNGYGHFIQLTAGARYHF